jgi:hypothetical protein
MAESDTGPSGGGDELEQRLIRDLRRMYHTEDAVAQALARVRKRVAESNTSILDAHPSTQHQQGLPGRQRVRPDHMHRDGMPSRFTVGRTWQQ